MKKQTRTINGELEWLKNFKVNYLPNCPIYKDNFWKMSLILKKSAVDGSSVHQELKGVHSKMLSTTVKAKFPWFYRYLLRQLKELESAWEELLAQHQTLNQNQCPEYQSKACLHEKCFQYFLFLKPSPIFFNKRLFGRHLPFRNGISGLIMNALINYV